MAHLVLARKYRPKNFDQVVGQDLIVATLKAAIEKNRVAHAMLFTGGRGIGKTTIARIVAKALVCTARQNVEPCGHCAQCHAVDNFSSLDVVEIDGASHTGVDDIRDLRDSARYQPTSAKYKIFIIDEVHMLSINAFNALLKILEEPPAHVMFIFATTEAHKIPKTILSRCQRYDFKRVSIDTIFHTLKSIVTEEGYSFDDDGLRLIASLADGGLRDALSMTEQIISNAHEHFSSDLVAQILGVVSHRAVRDLCQALIDGDVTSALLIVKEVYEKGLDLCHLMDAMTERFRMLSLCAHVDEKSVLTIIPILDEETILATKNHDKADLKRLFAMSVDGMTQVFQAEKPLFALELFILRAALRPPLSDAVTINYCLQKLDAIMHNRPIPKGSLSSDSVEKKTFDQKEALIPRDNTKKNSGELFSALVSDLAKRLPLLASHLRHARFEIDFTSNNLQLHFEQSLHYEQVFLHHKHDLFNESIKKVFGQELNIVLELKKSSSADFKAVKTVAEIEEEERKLEQDALYKSAALDPLVKKALEIFGGDITEVKRLKNHLNSNSPVAEGDPGSTHG